MKVTINQIRKELESIQIAHGMLNSFFWGDFLRAYKENTLDYPLMCCYTTQGGPMVRHLTQVTLIVVICDKTFKDSSNLPDVESDMLQVCRHIYNVISRSPRWRKIVTVRGTSEPKFIERGGDEVAGYAMQITLDIKDSESICDLPMFDYDFDRPDDRPVCEPGTIINSNYTFVDEVQSGSTKTLPDIPINITVNGVEKASFSIPAMSDQTIIITPNGN